MLVVVEADRWMMLLRGVSALKFYYAIAILFQLLLAFLTGDKNKASYMLHLWKNLFGSEGKE
jgi:hypothetical protein